MPKRSITIHTHAKIEWVYDSLGISLSKKEMDIFLGKATKTLTNKNKMYVVVINKEDNFFQI